jgi:hypothetical protein
MIRMSELLVVLLLLIPMVWALTDALRISSESWAASSQNQLVWVVVIVLAPLLGPVSYFFIARPRLYAS